MKDEATPEMIAMARRIAAETCQDPAWRPEIIAGKHDDWHSVRSALAAIIETTERAAKFIETHAYFSNGADAGMEPSRFAFDDRHHQTIAQSFRAGHHYGKDEG